MTRTIALGAACLLVSLLPAGATARYTVTDLGVPPGATSSSATDVNASGTVVGYVTLANGQTEAFAWSNGSFRLLGFLSRGSWSMATAINDAGVIVGDGNTASAEPRAAVWTDGTAGSIRDLTNGSGGSNIHAVDINASGTVAGYFTRSGSGNTNHWEAVTWAAPYSGDMVPLGPIPGSDPAVAFTIAQGLNDAGTVVGWTQVDATTAEQGFEHTAAGYELLGVTAVSGAQNSFAYAVNAAGDTVGYVDASRWDGAKWVFSNHAFLAIGGAMTDLGLLPGMLDSTASAINSRREIVGSSDDGAFSHAFVRLGADLFALDTLIDPGLGWTLSQAASINEAGQIAGTGVVGGHTHAFLLTPVPGPGTIAASLTARRDAGAPGRVTLAWSGSCGTASDYAVYEGQVGAWSSHEADTCSTAGATSATVSAAPGNRYFLVVPHDGNVEGGYGADAAGHERPRSAHPCFAGSNPNRCP